MDAGRWRKVGSIYHSACERKPEDVPGFLDDACSGDSEMRREVEALLEQGDSTASFLASPLEEHENTYAAAGTKLGQYRIEALLGKGGMGVVYRATDTDLGREVAIKVLPGSLARNPEQLARFRREARMLAMLNHPNIAILYGLQQSGDVHYLLMELVPGETLADRIVRGPVPVETVLTICSQVADALEAAHGKGVIHRDIKPANIKLTPEGRVKVLDFGLAKALEAEPEGRELADPSTVTAGPTRDGQILGTPSYMSPEQVRGAPLDHRSDIWAFGCVLFELLTGRRAFRGETLTETLAKVLEREPDWDALPASTQARIRALLERCLRKDPRQRLPDIGEARRQMNMRGRLLPWFSRRELTAAFVAAAFLLTLLAGYGIVNRRKTVEILAVFPFANPIGNPDAEYLSQGISESLIADLSQLPALRVLPRTSVARYALHGVDFSEIRRDLGVSKLVRGSVLLQGDSVLIRAELVNTTDNAVLWRDEYRRPNNKVLEIERSMVREILRQLRLNPAVRTGDRKTAASTGNPEAFRLYLQGRYYWSTRTEENLRRSAELFQQAINEDADYALAWAGLADAYLMLGGWSVLEPKNAYPRAKAAAERAIAMEETLAEPHATLGYLKTLYEWDWPGAGREFRRALELNPDYATAHHWYAFYFQTIGDAPKSLVEIERAREIDPLSPVISTEVAHFYRGARQYDRAAQEARKLLDVDPAFVLARIQLAKIYALQGKRREAVSELEALNKLTRPGRILVTQIATVLGLLGEHDKARVMLRDLIDPVRQQHVNPAAIAIAYAALGEKDKALENFEKALEERSIVPSWLRQPELDSLRPDPRFKALFHRLGLKP